MIKFTAVIPVYNRPEEIDELLESLTKQTYTHFEVIVVEDGSREGEKCEEITSSYSDRLDVKYFYKENTGQGFSRNYGFEKASGDYFVVFDSDCIIPEKYFEEVNSFLENQWLDAFGGPDRASEDFNDMQKAISYSMTSLFTTGGIRGKKKHVGQFQPRSFNMGISKEVFQKTGGYAMTNMGEDIEYSVRMINAGFKVDLIPEAYVYHKRRGSFKQFFKQIFSFGRSRIIMRSFLPGALKPVHFFPLCFVIAMLVFLMLPFINFDLFKIACIFVVFYFGGILLDSSIQNKSIKVGVLSIIASVVQLTAYGLGFLKELMTSK
ncbi:glycosyltransferase [Aureibacter tunicatorum]|uniref:Glycosyltransferase involved in cell wall biosynthesis n=1 Tax=Aureibacter tunicatorum TaxID=866807 RepID=A0AAE4BSK6_9BACT|nr:glycosyltransferase [Aureibacter tunicatorum]MDR6241329.1 glycosyltransferase involved in cell wall biosynthesis [Aureibacter tunicatorum]BDD03588.1 glycosyl transferase [Aureibacter tunicatorum]